MAGSKALEVRQVLRQVPWKSVVDTYAIVGISGNDNGQICHGRHYISEHLAIRLRCGIAPPQFILAAEWGLVTFGEFC
ncbi:MAG TPA: hypothetical protein VGD52_03465, partial [Pseudoduganella sp.]